LIEGDAMTQESLEQFFAPVTGEEFKSALLKLLGIPLVCAVMAPVAALAVYASWFQVELPGGMVLTAKLDQGPLRDPGHDVRQAARAAPRSREPADRRIRRTRQVSSMPDRVRFDRPGALSLSGTNHPPESFLPV